MNPSSPVHEIQPGEGYDIDSDEFNSEVEEDTIPDAEYEQLMEEGTFIPSLLVDVGYVLILYS